MRFLWREDGSVVYNCCWSSPAQSFSDSRLLFSSPPTTRRVTVEVFYPASTRDNIRSRTEQSSSLLPATSQHSHSWHRTPLARMAIYLFSVKTFVFFFFFFRCSSFDKKGGVGLFYNWCSLTTPYSTRGYIKLGDIYILYIIYKTQTDS
jgi:hypothetical protein